MEPLVVSHNYKLPIIENLICTTHLPAYVNQCYTHVFILLQFYIILFLHKEIYILDNNDVEEKHLKKKNSFPKVHAQVKILFTIASVSLF